MVRIPVRSCKGVNKNLGKFGQKFTHSLQSIWIAAGAGGSWFCIPLQLELFVIQPLLWGQFRLHR
jgi:hypothetical protein